MNTRTIYVQLLDEGVDVWAPVEAEVLGEDLFRLPEEAPAKEDWQFAPGSLVVGEPQSLSTGVVPCAVRQA